MEIYCILLVSGKFLSKDFKIEADLGSNEEILSKLDEDFKAGTLKVNSCNNLVDALNYMTLIGWEYVESLALQAAGGNTMGPSRYLMRYTYDK